MNRKLLLNLTHAGPLFRPVKSETSMAVGMVPAAPTGKPAQEASSAAFSQAPVLGERSSGLSSCSHASSSFQSSGAKQPSSLTSAEANTVQGRELSSTSTATYQEKRGVWAISMICFPCRDVLTKAVLLSHAAVGKEKALPQRGTQSLGNRQGGCRETYQEALMKRWRQPEALKVLISPRE